jgi:uncharacterized protein
LWGKENCKPEQWVQGMHFALEPIVLMSDYGEFTLSDNDNNLRSLFFANKILELIILPTEQCNFRCVYCYEKFVSGKMRPELVDAIKILIEKRASELSHLRIGWFGGEPLLAKNIILEISSYAMGLSKTIPGLYFDSGMSTNGYLLTLETAKELIANGVKDFQISFDGPASYHDKLRVLRNGKGTFGRIWKNLLDLKCSPLEFKVNLRIHLSKDNIEILNELIDTVRVNFNNDDRFRVFFKSLVPLGGKNDAFLNCLNEKETQKIIHTLKSRLGKGISLAMEGRDSYICYAGRPTSFVIRHDGRLVKCTVELDNPKNQIGRLKMDGTLDIEQNKIRPWFKGAITLNREILRCPKAFV